MYTREPIANTSMRGSASGTANLKSQYHVLNMAKPLAHGKEFINLYTICKKLRCKLMNDEDVPV